MKHTSILSVIALSALLTACGSSSDSTTDSPATELPATETPATETPVTETPVTEVPKTEEPTTTENSYAAFDAIKSAAYLNLESGTTVTKDENWHFSYQKYVGFTVNGGISGSGSVSACAAHTPEGLYDADKKPVQAAFEALTRDNTEAAFNAVTKASCSDADFVTDSITTYIKMEDWLAADYSQGAPVFTPSTETTNGWIVKSAKDDGNGNFNYGRVKINDVFYEAGAKRAITFAVEQWDDNGQVFEAASTSPEVDFTNARQYWDMETNTVVSATDDWELSIEYAGRSWNIQINAAVSGTGAAGVGHVLVNSGSAFDVTNPKASGDDIYKFYTDSANTALSAPGNYGAFQYGVAGGHNMWPTFTTYLFKDGDRFFKAQVVSNYGENGTLASGNLYVRYAEVTE